MNNTARRYTYGLYPKLAGCCLGFMAVFMITMTIISINVGIDWTSFFLLILTVFINYIGIVSFFSNVVYYISDDGIVLCKFGWKFRFVRWEDVAIIRKMRIWNQGYFKYQDIYYIYDGYPKISKSWLLNLYGPISFSELIRDLPNLISQINRYAQEYDIPLVVQDQETARKLAAQKGGSYLQQRIPKTTEIRVDKL